MGAAAHRGGHFSLTMLDATVSDCLDDAGRRMREINTDEAKSTSWVILDPRELQRGSACSTEHQRKHSRMLHVLSREEIHEALQCAHATNEDPASMAIGMIVNHMHDAMSSSKGVLVVDGVRNLTSYRLHYSQLRLNLYRQSMRENQTDNNDDGQW